MKYAIFYFSPTQWIIDIDLGKKDKNKKPMLGLTFK